MSNSPSRSAIRRRDQQARSAAKRRHQLVKDMSGNYRMFFAKLCTMPFRERFKAAVRILCKRPLRQTT